jgi:hypothetical protein
VRSVGVVVDPPFLDDLASLVEIGEQMFVQALVAQSAVEAFNKAILHRLAGCDVVPLDPEFLGEIANPDLRIVSGTNRERPLSSEGIRRQSRRGRLCLAGCRKQS